MAREPSDVHARGSTLVKIAAHRETNLRREHNLLPQCRALCVDDAGSTAIGGASSRSAAEKPGRCFLLGSSGASLEGSAAVRRRSLPSIRAAVASSFPAASASAHPRSSSVASACGLDSASPGNRNRHPDARCASFPATDSSPSHPRSLAPLPARLPLPRNCHTAAESHLHTAPM